MINEIEIKSKSKSEKSENDIKKRCQLFGVGHSKGKVFSELLEFRKNLRKVSQIYGVNLKWLNSWRREVEETVWLLFRGMLLEKLEESNDCLSPLSPLIVRQEIDASLAGADVNGSDKSVIQWYAPLKVNTVSSIYRCSQSQYDFNPRRYRKGYNPGKSVPKVYFSGLCYEISHHDTKTPRHEGYIKGSFINRLLVPLCLSALVAKILIGLRAMAGHH